MIAISIYVVKLWQVTEIRPESVQGLISIVLALHVWTHNGLGMPRIV